MLDCQQVQQDLETFNTFDADLTELQAGIALLEKRLEAIAKEVVVQQAALLRREHCQLLGELVIVLDGAASRFVTIVTQEEELCFTIGELQTFSGYPYDGPSGLGLPPEQVERWQHFKGFMESQGWPLRTLCAQSRELMDFCGGGRPSQEERAAVSLADLLKWADEVGYSCPERCRRFVQLVSKFFGKEGAPLLHRALSDVNAVLNGPQSSHGEQAAGKA